MQGSYSEKTSGHLSRDVAQRVISRDIAPKFPCNCIGSYKLLSPNSTALHGLSPSSLQSYPV